MQYLARREYSRAELRAKLLPRIQRNEEFDDAAFGSEPVSGESEQDLDALLDDLAKRGWLSDERAAAQLVHAKRGRYGTQRITHELRQRGIDEALIAQTLPELKDSELATAREVWRKKFGAPPQDAKEKARQMRFLQSRGFSMDVIYKAMGADAVED